MIVNVYEAKTHLSKLLNRVLNGEEIVIGRAGKPIARLVPFDAKRTPRVPGRLAGKIVLAEDFDATPGWLLDAFEGRE
jgi:prevent-host-death family protein